MRTLLVLPVLLFLSFTGFAQLKVLSNGDTFIPHGESFRIGSESGTGQRVRIVHHGIRDAVMEYYDNLYFNTGPSSSGGDRIHTMVLTNKGDVQIRKDLMVFDHLGVNAGPSSIHALNVDGSARIGSVTYPSDKRLKENVKAMEGDLGKLKKLKPVVYNYKDEVPGSAGADTASVATDASVTPTNGRSKKRDRVGFLAQDFQEVFPDLVYEDENGYLSIDYISLIPSLVEALQEQQAQIDELTEKSKTSKKNARSADLSKNESNGALADATETVLYQNRPNPFSESTEINIALADTKLPAYLYVYDMQGVQKKKYLVKGKGNTSVVIRGSELSAGMYMYALVVGDEVMDTKKMILTD